MGLWGRMALLVLGLPTIAAAQGSEEAGVGTDVSSPATAAEPADVPFGVGERLRYRVKFGPLEVGEARMEVDGIDTIAGYPTYHLLFTIRGGTFFYKIDDKQESWIDVYELASRRYRQDLHQGNYERLRVWDFDLESLIYVRNDGETGSIPGGALDEAAFIYFARTVPMQVGETYEWDRYFRWDRNPVILRVLRRETVRVPAGEFNTIVVRPIIKTRGIYAEEGEAEVYVTDDERRIPVMLKSRLKVGQLSLELTEFVEGTKLTSEDLAAALAGRR